MINPKVSNPNDFKVVDFTNRTDFDFTPEMGCMFDSNPIFGTSGSQGIKAGESLKLPYHVGHRLAINLAKAKMVRSAGPDTPNNPTGQVLWDDVRLTALKNSFITDLYSEAKPVAETEVSLLMKKVAELNKLVTENIKTPAPSATPEQNVEGGKPFFLDKQEVVAELTKRKVTFDPRASKEELEKLIS